MNSLPLLTFVIFNLFFVYLNSEKSIDSNIGYFAHLTDIHYDESYVEGSYAQCIKSIVGLPCCQTRVIPYGLRTAGRYGDVLCDSPKVLIEETLEFVKNFKYPLDFLFYTGDMVSHNDLTQTEQGNLESIINVTNLIKSKFSQTPIFPVLGNHDTWPVDQFGSEHQNPMIDVIAQHWSKWFDDVAFRTFKKGGYYSIKILPGLKIIALNTLLHDALNLYSTQQAIDEQWKWLNSTLISARSNGEKVWILGHVPPGNTENTDIGAIEFQRVVSHFSDVITNSFFGHTHTDGFTLLRDKDFNVRSLVFIAPSVTPKGMMNPSVRIYEYDKRTHEILNIHQYHAHLESANRNKKLEFELFYSMKELFNMTDLSCSSFHELSKKMKEDDSHYLKFINSYYGGVENEINMCLDNPKCKRTRICESAYGTQAERQKCQSVFVL